MMLFSGATYDRHGTEMLDQGLYVELGAWNSNFFHCVRLQHEEIKILGNKTKSRSDIDPLTELGIQKVL